MASNICSACGGQIPPGAENCPHCGHHIGPAGNKPKAKRRGCLKLSIGCLGLVLVLLVVFAGLAIAFKPDEKALRDGACKKSGSIACGAGSAGETIGLYKISYHDHTVFSTLTLKLPGDSERTVALGVLGQVIALELPDPPKIR